MNKTELETKSLVYIVLFGYIFNLIFGWLGFFFDHVSSEQLLLYQVGNACSISASVMAGRYIGIRGQHVAASAFILLGITHGISLAALSKAGINAEREATMVMPMIPALLFMFWCDLFPKWLRYLAMVPSILFALVFVHVHLGDHQLGWTLYAGYATLQIIELLWGIYIYKDWRHLKLSK